MATQTTHEPELKRVSTGIAGLDTILNGGVLEGGLYLIAGVPGAGKTIFANQMCFSHVKKGGRALYVTLLGESHGRMLQQLRILDFFDSSRIPEALYYVSGAQSLEEQNLSRLLELLRTEISIHQATLLVIDGLNAIATNQPEKEVRRFVYQLQSELDAAGCVAIMTTTDQTGSANRPEYTLVDGILLLQQAAFGVRTYRHLEVQKLRGGDFLSGKHAYEITAAGIEIYPRIEAVYARPSAEDKSRGRRTTVGVRDLDEMLWGGLPSGTTTLLLGPSGVGKTVIGLHFVCCATKEQPALFYSFYETPERLLMKAKSLNLGFEKLIDAGLLEVIWQPPSGDPMDKVAHRLLEAVKRRGVRRLFLDGLGGFQEAATEPDRLVKFFGALMNELRINDVTSIYTGETRVIIGSEVRSPIDGLSMIAENVLLLRFVELRSRLYRMFSTLKIRDSAFDGTLREFRIGANGIDLSRTIDSAEAILEDLQQSRVGRGSIDEARSRQKRRRTP